MSLRDRLFGLQTEDEVKQFLEGKRVAALFKAGGCHKTGQGFGFVEQAMNRRPDVPMGFVKVIEHRPASNYITEITGVIHQSPQFILLIDGKPVFDVDNWDITLEVMETALDEHLGEVSSENTSKESKMENVGPYIALIEQYLAGDLDAEQFSNQWLSTFQMDGNLHSTEQFNLLNNLFGDVDEAIQSRHICAGRKIEEETLKTRATELLNVLKA